MKYTTMKRLVIAFAVAAFIALPSTAFAEEPAGVGDPDSVGIISGADDLEQGDAASGSGSDMQGGESLAQVDAEEPDDGLEAQEPSDGDGAAGEATGVGDVVEAEQPSSADSDASDENVALEAADGGTEADEGAAIPEEGAPAVDTPDDVAEAQDAVVAEGPMAAADPVKAAAVTQPASSASSSTASSAPASSAPAVKAAATAYDPKTNPAYAAGFRNGHEYLLLPRHAGSRALASSGGKAVSGQLARTATQMWRCVFTSDGYVTFTCGGKALAVSGGKAKNGASVVLAAPSGSFAQKWTVQKSGSAFVILSALSAANAKFALDVANADASAGAAVQLYAANGTKAQLWAASDASVKRASLDKRAKASKATAGKYAIASAVGSSQSMAASGSNVKDAAYTGAATQKWTVVIGKDGYATFKASDGRVLDVAGGKGVAGANVGLYKANGSRAQKWIITKNSNGTVTIESALWPGLVLDVAGASAKSGANIQIYTSNSSKAQRWDMRKLTPTVAASDEVAEGWYVIWAKKKGTVCLDVQGASASAGAKVQLYAGNGSLAQRFRVVKAGKYYRLEPGCAPGKAVSVNGSRVVPGAASKTATGKLVSFKKGSSGAYLITDVSSGLTLGTAGGKTGKGIAIQGRDAALGGRIGFVLEKKHGVLDNATFELKTALSGGRVVSVAGESRSNGATLDMESFDRELSQKWHAFAVSGKANVYTFESLATGMRLTGTSNDRASQSTSNGTLQQWRPTPAGGNYIVLKNIKTGQALDVSGANTAQGTAVMCWNANGTAAQKWSPVKVKDVDTGLYEFCLAANSGVALDADSGSTNVHTWEKNDSYNQRWYFNADTGTLSNLSMGKVLDVYNGWKASGTNVQQYEANGSAAQKWKIAYDKSGRFKVTSSLGSNLVLTSTGTSRNSNVNISADDKTTKQRWTMKRCDITVSSAMRKNLSGIDMRGVRGVGIDVSHWQGAINWGAVKAAGVDFAILRIGHGTAQSDTQLRANVQGCIANGIPFGLYYYSTATSTSGARAEASHALSLMKQAGVTKSNTAYAVYYDLEESSMASTANRKLLANMTSTFLGAMSGNGYKTGVYANLNWWNNYLTDSSFDKYDRWVAQWHVSRTTCAKPYHVWQIHSDGSVPGISGRVDIDVMY